MNQPRYISGHAIPHYAGSRPGLFSALVKSCTHPTSSAYLDSVAEKLLQQFKEVPLVKLAKPGEPAGKSNSQLQGSTIVLNRAGAKSVVQMAVKLGLLSENFFWSWKGHVINIVCEKEKSQSGSFLELDFAERIAYLKYYLEAEGAMLLTLGERILENPAGITTKDFFEEPIVDVAFRKIDRSYLERTSDLGRRTELRYKLVRLEAHPLKPYTRRHKILPRLIPLEDLGLLVREMTSEGETFLPLKRGTKIPLKTLVGDLRNIETMEQRFARGEYFAIIANTLCDNVKILSLDEHETLLSKEVAYVYVKLQDTGAAVYSLDAIGDVACTRLLANCAILASPEQVVELLQRLQKDRPYDVRFHVDRQGRPAYLILSENLLKEMGSDEHQ